MPVFLIATMLIAFVPSAPLWAERDRRVEESPWVGAYRCQGESATGKAYEVDLSIQSVGGQIYELRWTAGGQLVSIGGGVIIGDTLSAAFLLRDAFGHVAYRRAADGALDGRWFGIGEWVDNRERCRRADVVPAE